MQLGFISYYIRWQIFSVTVWFLLQALNGNSIIWGCEVWEGYNAVFKRIFLKNIFKIILK
jgi:hypothetical protein